MDIFGNEKVCSVFYCKNCDYSTSKKSNYDKHILTAKHQKIIEGDNLCGKGDSKIILACDKCKKVYKSRNGLWKHNKVCDYNVPDTINENNDFISIFIKENADS